MTMTLLQFLIGLGVCTSLISMVCCYCSYRGKKATEEDLLRAQQFAEETNAFLASMEETARNRDNHQQETHLQARRMRGLTNQIRDLIPNPRTGEEEIVIERRDYTLTGTDEAEAGLERVRRLLGEAGITDSDSEDERGVLRNNP